MKKKENNINIISGYEILNVHTGSNFVYDLLELPLPSFTNTHNVGR